MLIKYSFKLSFYLLIYALVLIPQLHAHGAGEIKSSIFIGCHKDNKRNKFHCHERSLYNGLEWSSKGEAFKWYKEELNKKAKGSGIKGSSSPQEESVYQRSEWGTYWNDFDGDCIDTRNTVLRRDSIESTILSEDGCKIIKGKWKDFYTGTITKNPSELEVDHVVPVKKAHDYSKGKWTTKQKKYFYNDTENLVLTSKSTNASKGSNDFVNWSPTTKERSCEYAKVWFKIKRKYGFPLNEQERKNLKALGVCKI